MPVPFHLEVRKGRDEVPRGEGWFEKQESASQKVVCRSSRATRHSRVRGHMSAEEVARNQCLKRKRQLTKKTDLPEAMSPETAPRPWGGGPQAEPGCAPLSGDEAASAAGQVHREIFRVQQCLRRALR